MNGTFTAQVIWAIAMQNIPPICSFITWTNLYCFYSLGAALDRLSLMRMYVYICTPIRSAGCGRDRSAGALYSCDLCLIITTPVYIIDVILTCAHQSGPRHHFSGTMAASIRGNHNTYTARFLFHLASVNPREVIAYMSDNEVLILLE